MPNPKEQVHHPAHYGGADNPYEAIKVIEAWGPLASTFCVGSALKYICRAGKKGDSASQDLRKAAWYLNHQADLEAEKERKERAEPVIEEFEAVDPGPTPEQLTAARQLWASLRRSKEKSPTPFPNED